MRSATADSGQKRALAMRSPSPSASDAEARDEPVGVGSLGRDGPRCASPPPTAPAPAPRARLRPVLKSYATQIQRLVLNGAHLAAKLEAARAGRRRFSVKNFWRWTPGLVAVTLAIGACDASSPPTPSLTPSEPSTSTEGRIGPEGGVLSLDGVTVEVPPNALTESVVLRVTRSGDAPAMYRPLTARFEFEPHNLRFAVPVRVIFRLVRQAPPEATAFWTLDDARVQFGPLSSLVGPESSVTTSVVHFSSGFVGLPPVVVDAGATPLLDTTSGTRLRAQRARIVAADGTELPPQRRWLDQLRNETCQTDWRNEADRRGDALGFDGQVRCIPSDHNLPRDIQFAYLDASCSGAPHITDAFGRCTPPVGYALESSGCAVTVRKLGPPVSVASPFFRSGDCRNASPNWSRPLFAIGDAVALTEFGSFKVTASGVGLHPSFVEGLRYKAFVEELLSPDGARFTRLGGLWDSARAEVCDVHAEVYPVRCLPRGIPFYRNDSSTVQDTAVYADAQCTTQVAIGGCGRVPSHVYVNTPEGVKLRAVGPQTTYLTVYRKRSGRGCEAATTGALPLVNVAGGPLVGPAIDLAEFGAFTAQQAPLTPSGTRLVGTRSEFRGPDGSVFDRGFVTVRDTQRDNEVCSFEQTSDGKVRCVPQADPYESLLHSYADAACTVPARISGVTGPHYWRDTCGGPRKLMGALTSGNGYRKQADGSCSELTSRVRPLLDVVIPDDAFVEGTLVVEQQ